MIWFSEQSDIVAMTNSEHSISYVDFEELAGDAASPAVSNSATTEHGDDLTGALFADKYLVLEKLGEGGVGAVYKVKHVHLDRPFALKVLQTSHARGDAVLRFQQEAKVVSSLTHPNIVKITDFGITTDGRPYMVMDLLEGLPLSVFRHKAELPAPRLARIFRQVCDALAYAHEHGIVHRDVKPGNIVVRTDRDGIDWVTVVDFGIAKVLPSEDSGEMHLTRTGDVFGTPLYMSPEQCLGQNVDSRADIYSLGCVMYEAYAGVAPFRGESLFQVINQQINDTPPSITKGKRTTSERRLEAVILRAMAKKPQDRYRFAVEMATDLKLVEIVESDLLSDFRLFLKMSQGRSRAGSKTKALWDLGAQMAIPLALICVCVLFTFPSWTRTEINKMTRNELLLTHLEEAIGNRAKKTKQLNETLSKFKRGLVAMAPLCKYDAREQAIYDKLEIEAPLADRHTRKMVSNVRSLLISDMESVGPAFSHLNEIINRWLSCAALYSDLRAVAFEHYQHHKTTISWLIPIFEVAKWLGIALLAFLGAFLGTRLQKHQKSKAVSAKE